MQSKLHFVNPNAKSPSQYHRYYDSSLMMLRLRFVLNELSKVRKIAKFRLDRIITLLPQTLEWQRRPPQFRWSHLRQRNPWGNHPSAQSSCSRSLGWPLIFVAPSLGLCYSKTKSFWSTVFYLQMIRADQRFIHGISDLLGSNFRRFQTFKSSPI